MDKFLAQRLRQSREALQQNRMYFMWAHLQRNRFIPQPDEAEPSLWERIKSFAKSAWARIRGVFSK